ncbi:MAG: hypothetical protein K1W33_02810 [Clostridia bacterium]
MKSKKIISSFILVITLLVFSNQYAYAANETWYKGNTYSASYTVTNNNLTPYKIIGSSGQLCIQGTFCKADSPSYSNVRITVELREYGTGSVLARTVQDNTSYPNSNSFVVSTNVYSGQKIQIFIDISSTNNPPGSYRSASVQYSAFFI